MTVVCMYLIILFDDGVFKGSDNFFVINQLQGGQKVMMILSINFGHFFKAFMCVFI